MSAFDRLALVSKICPEAFRGVDVFAQAKFEKEYEWPDWCFLPMSAWISIVSKGQDTEPRLQILNRVYQIAAPATWRYTQGIYRFDPEVYEAICNSDFMGKIPCEALLRLPEWCVYIETPNLRDEVGALEGFFALLEFDYQTGTKELRFYVDRVGEPLAPLVLYLKDGNTIEDSIQEMLDTSLQNAKEMGLTESQFMAHSASMEAMRTVAQRLLPFVMYLCTELPEIEEATTPDWVPHNPSPKTIRGAFRLMPAKKPRHYVLGRKTGDELRKARQHAAEVGHDGRTVSPHIRRAHWHGFWTGPRKGKQAVNQHFVLRWLPPIVVLGSKNTSL